MPSILVIGSGGREHAICWKLRAEGHDVHAAPGSDGIVAEATCHDVGVGNHDAIVSLASRLRADLVVIGPEQPLVEGLGDRLRASSIPTFGPSAAAAELEGSKAAAKAFMVEHQIPTAAHHTVHDLAQARQALARFEHPPVIKADGLAAGKGVTVPETFDEAEAAVVACLQERRFGTAGAQVVLEERLHGPEVSLFVLTDGTTVRTFAAAQDHKRIGEGDTGPNTGGMGAYVPAPVFTAQARQRAVAEIVEPTLAGLRAQGRAFVGVLFVGLMIPEDGQPRVIEYNCRFGDPEAQPLMFGLREDVYPHLHGAAVGALRPGEMAAMPAATVVLASAGYPASSSKGDRIEGLGQAAALPDVQIFHAGTRRDAEGGWETAGGRVLGVCARADALDAALRRAYEAAGHIAFAGMQMRRDIGAQAVGGRLG